MEQKAESVRTVVFVRAMGVAVDGAGLAVCGPAGVSQAEVCVELLFQVQRIFLCVSNNGREALSRGGDQHKIKPRSANVGFGIGQINGDEATFGKL